MSGCGAKSSEPEVASSQACLSRHDAAVIVDLIDMSISHSNSLDGNNSEKEKLALFMSIVHKFAFGMNRKDNESQYSRLCGLNVASTRDQQLVAVWAQQPVSDWNID